MRILLTGSSGLIGRHLLPRLRSAGHEVIRLWRELPPESKSLPADAILPDLNSAAAQPALDRFDAVIHLAGQNVDRRWTAKNKTSILASRGDFTSHLCQALARLPHPPAHFLSASATGYYGYNHPGQTLTESAPPGEGFLAQVCQAWESATKALTPFSRIVHMRFAVALTPDGGALAKMLPLFRKGLGGVLSNGRQMMSWITLPDLLKAIEFILNTPALTGPLNICSPHPVSNRQFTKALAHALHRPAFLRVPKAALMLIFGQMAKETILGDVAVTPARLLESGFNFTHPKIEEALVNLLH